MFISEFPHRDGIYFQNGRQYVPVYHPAINTPCDCHLAYPNPSSKRSPRETNQTTHKHLNPHNQRLNGVIGCIHHPVNGVNAAAWHRHAYTLPYVHNHQLHQIQSLPPQELVYPRQQDQVSPRQHEVTQTFSRHDGVQPMSHANSESGMTSPRVLSETSQTFDV